METTGVPDNIAADGSTAVLAGATTTYAWRLWPAVCSDDVSVQADFVSATSAQCYLMARASAASTDDCYIVLNRASGPGNDLVLYSRNGGIGTLIGSYATGGTFTIKLECIGTTIKVYADGIERISVPDTDHAATNYVGFGLTGNVGITVDNFIAAEA